MTSQVWSGIHPQAIVDPSATIGENVTIGPWTWVGPDVEIADGTEVLSHVVIKGPTTIGRNNRIFQFSSIGEECQDKKYDGEPTTLVIGDNNIIRENTTIHRGTAQDRGETRIGSNNLLMAYVHVAHDCVVGDDTILANCATLAGHVTVGDWAILGGGSMVHQFCHIGPHSMSAGGSIILKDIPAYIMASGQSAGAHGLNAEGLKRRGFSREVIRDLRRAYKVIYRQGLTLAQATETLETEFTDTPEMRLLIDSLKQAGRGIVR
ncbi:acyl-[acyl-carrier-protein]--UDP-N-acetylglucosamine O-acyltransferase [Tamilnaduibacter salinus]|uniref:Acyl-[acyl-carrier-protein]--UDP-N-acetylglucosamine O-acyltransferase n=1 Tax=Tamilnaduibacter salinus TaxID=1484056 RepID=A0A2A2I1E8_9GAMM|nr:acyl-ACP--UDP-N-acetylglucosamine O-acyltransferase [Tamilnaduibacter salinus]PAV24833.1 acyl-[acyl-carrier-protein]--UDP-N-acetylglucosamine O-acyltransferase [Tamilnaduibacter salinus]PVY69796.1 acyl-[acyl-carrier-protein]--UDP-N-acetylglucosamine O-acyltransferase [Tamilnaduibacter salinus]